MLLELPQTYLQHEGGCDMDYTMSRKRHNAQADSMSVPGIGELRTSWVWTSWGPRAHSRVQGQARGRHYQATQGGFESFGTSMHRGFESS